MAACWNAAFAGAAGPAGPAGFAALLRCMSRSFRTVAAVWKPISITCQGSSSSSGISSIRSLLVAGELHQLVPDLRIFGGLGEGVAIAADAKSQVHGNTLMMDRQPHGCGDERKQLDQRRRRSESDAGDRWRRRRPPLDGSVIARWGIDSVCSRNGLKCDTCCSYAARARRAGHVTDLGEHHDKPVFLSGKRGDDRTVDASVVEDDGEVLWPWFSYNGLPARFPNQKITRAGSPLYKGQYDFQNSRRTCQPHCFHALIQLHSAGNQAGDIDLLFGERANRLRGTARSGCPGTVISSITSGARFRDLPAATVLLRTIVPRGRTICIASSSPAALPVQSTTTS